MSYRTFFFLGRQFIAAGEAEPTRIHGEIHPPFSFLYVCQTCGDPWGKLAVESTKTTWVPLQRKCPTCGKGYLAPYDENYSIPEEVMYYELERAYTLNDTPEGYQAFLIFGGS